MKGLYKTSEIIEVLEVNPNLKIISSDGYKAAVAEDRLCWNGNPSLPVNIGFGEEKILWRIIEAPYEVTAEEAIRAYVKGKFVYCQYKGATSCYHKNYAEPLFVLRTDKFINGKWFVKE